ncbi:MAG: hypothetical protein OQK82_03330, partial [Candidatus Pacearchaeota archaeon]|nr:hypothetical protein [Candidatus Pacearchaeota archaeon]
KTIQYTGNTKTKENGPYTIEFKRDLQLDETRRKDVIIDARGGYKDVTAELLRKIKIYFRSNNLVRSYDFTYEEGAFGKTRLLELTQKGANGETDLFNHHKFSYYDEVPTEGTSNNYNIFTDKQTLETPDDGLNSKTFTSKVFHQTFLGGSFGYNVGYNGSFGITGPFLGTLASGNARHSGNSSSSETKISLMDINGDGKPDKVFHNGGHVKYRKNITSPSDNQIRFSSTVYDVTPISNMIRTTSDSSTTGFNGYAFGGTAFRQKITTTSTDKSFFADVNGDGLVDHVDNGRVLFNYMTDMSKQDVEVDFSIDSDDTENPIDGGAMSSSDLFDAFSTAEEDLKAKNPLLDAVKRWVAPYDGTIRIDGTFQLHNFYTDTTLEDHEQDMRSNYKTDDGVMIAIQKNNFEIWRVEIPKDDNDPHEYTDPKLTNISVSGGEASSLSNLSVKKGDKLYFRVMSIDDGSYDRVNWSPNIVYLNSGHQPRHFLDVNNRNAYHFNALDDHILAGQPMAIAAPYDGTIEFKGTFKKDITTDDVKVAISIYEYNEDTETLSKIPKTGQNGSTSIIIPWNSDEDESFSKTFEVETDDRIVINYYVDSPIDLTSLQWTVKPQMYYTEASRRTIDLLQPPVSEGSDLPPEERDLPEDNSDIGNINLDDYTPPTEGDTSIPGAPVRAYDEDTKEYLIKLPVNLNMDIYTKNSIDGAIQMPWKGRVDKAGNLVIAPWITVQTKQQVCDELYGDSGFISNLFRNCSNIPETPNGEVFFTVKRRGELLYKQKIEIINEQVVASTIGYDAITIQHVEAEDELFLDFTTRDHLLASRINAPTVRIDYGNDTPWKVPFADNIDVTVNSYVRDNRNSNNYNTTSNSDVMILIRNEQNTIVDSRRVNVPYDSYFRLEETFDNLPVHSGDQLYFDIVSIYDYHYINESETGIWSRYPGAQQWVIPKAGLISIDPILTFNNGQLPDGDLILKAYRNNQHVDDRNYNVNNGQLIPANESNFNPFPMVLDVEKGDKLRIDFWTHSHNLSSVLHDKGQISIDYINKQSWKVPDIDHDSETFTNVSLNVTPALEFDFQGDKFDSEINFNILKNNQLLATEVFQIVNGRLIAPDLPIALTVKENDTLNFEFTTIGEPILTYLQSHSVSVGINFNNYSAPSVFNTLDIIKPVNALFILMPRKTQTLAVEHGVIHYPFIENLFGEIYRGWGQAAYLANGDRANQVIDQNKLKLPEDKSAINTFDTDAYPASPSNEDGEWNSADGSWHTSGHYIQSTRRGLKYIDIPKPEDFERDDTNERTAGIVRVPRFSISDGYSDGGGYVLTYSRTKTTTNGKLDLMDLNGDRYPDIVSSNSIQFTLPDGRMGEVEKHGATRKTSSDDNSLSFGGGTEPPTGPNGRFGIPPKSSTNPDNISIGGSLGGGDSEGVYDYMDMNGDGLVDKVAVSGGTIKVALNMGYSFDSFEVWTKEKSDDTNIVVNQGTSETYGFNVGWSAPGRTFSGGVNLNLGVSHVSHRLMDMNGDGLTDFVFTTDSGSNKDYLFVAINLGGKFASPIKWGKPLKTLSDISPLGSFGVASPISPQTAISDGYSTSVTISGNGTAGITIPCPLPCLDVVFGGGGNYGETVSQPTVGYNDVNGDGFIDSIRSDNDSKLEVSLSQIGRTNMLKTVTRPQGAAFTLEYKRVGNTYDLPQSMWVMSQVVLFDGTSSDAPAQDLSLSSDYRVFTIDYENGIHDRFEREFLGFEEVTQNELATTGVNANRGETLDDIFAPARIKNDLLQAKDEDGNEVTRSAYRQTVQIFLNNSFYTKGLLVESQTLGQANPDVSNDLSLYRQSINKYILKPLVEGNVTELDDLSSQTQLDLLDAYTDAGTSIFPYLKETEQRLYEGGSTYKSTKTENDYDDYGNVITFKDYGDEGTHDDVIATITYSHTVGDCRTPHYIVGKPTSITVTDHSGNSTLRKREGEYYCNDGTGNLKSISQYATKSISAVTTMDIYDDYG